METASTEKVNTGWVFLWNATRCHYFGDDGRSLCGKWLYLGRHDRTGDGIASPDDCKACTRKLERNAKVAA